MRWHWDSGQTPPGGDLEPGRVLAVNRTNYEILTEEGPCLAELTGRMRYAIEDDLELPVAGDWVAVRRVGELALISQVLERRGVLRRRRPGSEAGVQIIAAQVDVAFLVHGCNLPVNVRRLERFAAAVRDGGIQPMVVLNKADLLDASQRASALKAVAHLGPALLTSGLKGHGMEDLSRRMEAGKTHVLLGASGAGKTTLLNGLLGAPQFATAAVRESDGKGRHTTTRRHLVELPSGAFLIDTPGVREMGMTDMDEGISGTFQEVARLAEDCRFRDCTHQGQAGCMVEAAVDSGALDPEILSAYLRLEREAAHYERSVAERRRRDKEFGRMVKDIMKHKKDRR